MVNIGDKPQADFSQPIELMMDCHRRIERFLISLAKVSRTSSAASLDDPHREALRTALDYFTQAGPRHNQDEEASLFPALKELHHSEIQAAVTKIAELAGEHRQAEQIHKRIDDLGRQWLAKGRIGPDELHEFGGLVDQLIKLYEPHIAMEEREIFPLAARMLAPQAIAEIGEQMRLRRIVNPGREGSACSKRRKSNRI